MLVTSFYHSDITKATGKLISTYPKGSQTKKNDDTPALPVLKTAEALNQLATAKLAEIVRRGVAIEAGWEGYDAAELIAAQALLEKDVTPKTH